MEYLDPGEAKKGFKNLAYSKFKYLPLYLEWAPLNVFTSEFSGTAVKPNSKEETAKGEQIFWLRILVFRFNLYFYLIFPIVYWYIYYNFLHNTKRK